MFLYALRKIVALFLLISIIFVNTRTNAQVADSLDKEFVSQESNTETQGAEYESPSQEEAVNASLFQLFDEKIRPVLVDFHNFTVSQSEKYNNEEIDKETFRQKMAERVPGVLAALYDFMNQNNLSQQVERRQMNKNDRPIAGFCEGEYDFPGYPLYWFFNYPASHFNEAVTPIITYLLDLSEKNTDEELRRGLAVLIKRIEHYRSVVFVNTRTNVQVTDSLDKEFVSQESNTETQDSKQESSGQQEAVDASLFQLFDEKIRPVLVDFHNFTVSQSEKYNNEEIDKETFRQKMAERIPGVLATLYDFMNYKNLSREVERRQIDDDREGYCEGEYNFPGYGLYDFFSHPVSHFNEAVTPIITYLLDLSEKNTDEELRRGLAVLIERIERYKLSVLFNFFREELRQRATKQMSYEGT